MLEKLRKRLRDNIRKFQVSQKLQLEMIQAVTNHEKVSFQQLKLLEIPVKF